MTKFYYLAELCFRESDVVNSQLIKNVLINISQTFANKKYIKFMKQYNLQQRTKKFARDIRTFIQKILRTLINTDDMKQLLRSSGSVGANYLEADEALSKKDFANRIKISRKESKESHYWLELLEINLDSSLEVERQRLLKESHELVLIFNSIVRKTGFEHLQGKE